MELCPFEKLKMMLLTAKLRERDIVMAIDDVLETHDVGDCILCSPDDDDDDTN